MCSDEDEGIELLIDLFVHKSSSNCFQEGFLAAFGLVWALMG